jgi:hypothetical protein
MSINTTNINLDNMTPNELKVAYDKTIFNIKAIINSIGSYTNIPETTEFRMTDKAYNELSSMWTYVYNILDAMTTKANKLGDIKRDKLMVADTNIDKAKKEIDTHQELINDNKKEISSRERQYELAIERNAHRRRMVIMLAILNTIFLMIYYFVTK